ncbi:hypothetical protein IV203_031258 [Nitzschia inconspicua]|uniref:Uncharacterized protein n=1 Tax=Nitzschia inconspicua TaxID=303405 RepID=A0A9K3Q2Z2_9STRA|nr:hypothetical protein IV203_031258 [Nitzschia inconspicua]
MTHHRPGCLFGKNHGRVDLLDDTSEGLQACKTYATWIGDGTSAYSLPLTRALTGHLNSLRRTFSRTDGGERMARSLLDDISKQWNDLCNFTQTFYTKLVNVAKFSEANAFKLVGRCWGAVFDTMRSHREALKLVGDLQAPGNKAMVIWSVFQCHRIMKEFIALDFEGHPAIVKEISLFIITERVDPTEILRLTSRMKKLEDEYAAVTETNQKLRSSHADFQVTFMGLKRTVDDLKNELKQLKTKK